MLATVGVHDQDGLFDSLPTAIRRKPTLPAGLSEPELVEYFGALARENDDLTRLHGFLGAGAYRRFIPAAVTQVISRPEVFTAYTPYQAEASQGGLPSLFEVEC